MNKSPEDFTIGATQPVVTQLSSSEKSKLRKHEEIISRGLNTFLDVGCALGAIKEDQLYREDYPTFAEYCRKKWDLSRIHAYRLVNAAEVCRLLPNGNTPLPDNEAQVRPLTSLPRERVASVWIQAVRKAGKDRITARVVEEVVATFAKGTNSQRRKQVSPEHWQTLALQVAKEMKEAILTARTDDILQKIEKIRVLVEQLALSGVNTPRFQEDEP